MRRLVVLIVALIVVAACGGDGASGRCEDGEVRECYSGPLGSEGVGTCKAGIETCANGTFTGICIGDIVPFVERCDGEDEDCNGEVDDVDGSGGACSSGGCEGAMACVGEELRCVAPARNECDVCGGDSITDLGTGCASADGCTGALVCNGAGDGTTCNAPGRNACDLCGGPPIVGLDEDCTRDNPACAGLNVCNENGNGVVCDCNPRPGQCRQPDGTFRPVVSPGVGDLVITEVMPNPNSVPDATGEWFEVKALVDVDLNELGLDRASDGSPPILVSSVDCIRLAAGEYAVFAKSTDPATNGNLPAAAIKGVFNFALIDGTTQNPGEVQILIDATVIDAITWTSTRAGRTHALHPDFENATANDLPSNFCDGTTIYNTNENAVSDFGTPGAANEACTLAPPPGSCDPGNGPFRTIRTPAVGELVITELLTNAAGADGSDTKVWFEIANVGQAAFDLNGLTVSRTGATATVVTSAACIPVDPGAFALFARSTNVELNGGLAVVDATFTFSLPDSGDNRNLSVLDGTTLLDTVTYTATGTGGSSADGKSVQLDPDHFTTSANDLMNPAAGTVCQGTTTYGSDPANFGTPRGPNLQCP